MSKILIITDAWNPQVNGVVRTLNATAKCLREKQFEVHFLTPKDFFGFPWPFYKEISISLPMIWVLIKKLRELKPDYIHIATEGILGLMGRWACNKAELSYTTSYHTRFPEYLKQIYKVPLFLSYKYFRWFHSQSKKILVPTSSIKKILENQQFKNIEIWHRGVDSQSFKPYKKNVIFKRPILVYVGRISSEKNIEAFLDLQTIGTKIVVGDGPQREKLEKEYPDVKFFGSKSGKELAELYSQGDVFVFPSKSDTFGLVLLESLSCGVPFASYKESGPIDIAATNKELAEKSCFISDNLEDAVENALKNGNSPAALELANIFSWENCTNIFIENLVECNNS